MTLAFKYGQLRSMRQMAPVDRLGRAIPWYTYPAIDFIDALELTGLKVLEYGSGNSTLYFLRRGAAVASVEDDRAWFSKIGTGRDRHSYIFAQEKYEYAERNELHDADIIVIDGSFRYECAQAFVRASIKGFSKPALVVLDNSDWFPDAVAEINDRLGWHRVDFKGFGPINGYTWVTTMFLNPLRRLPFVAGAPLSVSGRPAPKN